MSDPLTSRSGNVPKSSKGNKSIEDTYQKKTQHEHILARPDMYIGSCERVTDDCWVYDDGTEQMVQRKCSWIPGLYKIFDEILVNSADNKVRDPEGQTQVQVDIDRDTGKIRVWNNGEGIPIKKHKVHDLWIPEMIFGHLLTSSNYDDTEKKVTGGRNGYGAKLTNVFSKKFIVETCHRGSGQKFKMTWRNNMLEHDQPEMSSASSSDEDYTCVTFWPDFHKFGMAGMEDDIYEIMKRRVVDLAGVTDPSMKVRLNGKMLKVRNFQQYVELYPVFGEEKNDKSFAKVNERWQVCVRISNIGYQQVSFVNSIATTRGGNHVKYITDQIIDKVIEAAKKKAKGTEVKAHMIKPHLWVFVNCLIDNPSFDSQTKETLNSTKTNFGSTCSLPTSLIDYILKAGLLDRSVETANSKLTKQMMAKAKAGSGRVTGIPKLEDANEAGGRHAADCTLILTEGDSAKALAVGGLGTIGRDKYGVFPLRGKPLNVRDAGMKKVMTCAEIQAIIKIMGLKMGQQYTSVEGLRYGHIMIMSDQDHDGSHIKGLIVNFIHTFWPSLARIPGFVTQFITPIVKVFHKRSHEVKSYFALNQFLEWRRSLSDDEMKQWTIKYYKGLGTSTSKEGKEYFSNLREHKIDFAYQNDGDDDRHILLAFAKDKVDDRKKWILDYKSSQPEHVDYRIKKIRYKDFINKELIQFSIADCERSIPCVVDGFKPGQRKILYCCFKRNLRTSIKVAQLAGYVSEHAAYHHGEASLQSTIVGLAQDFVGANNVPLLYPDGQFGTRLQGGKDCASARYIFTKLQPLARAIFHKSDDDILVYKDDDGFPVEPEYYVPVIPLVLVNGTAGIGTGFATSIPNYNPWDVITNLKNLMSGKDLIPMVPWYYGFQGTISEKEKGKFVSVGKVSVIDDMLVRVQELPIGYWTNQYKAFLEELMQKELVLNFREHHTDTTVDFDIVLHPEVLRTWKEKGILEDKLELKSPIPASNLMCFDEDGKLTKYQDAEAILKAFYIIRLEFYGKRKEHMLSLLRALCEKLKNMVRFIREVIEGSMVISKKKKPVLLKELQSRGYKAFPPKSHKVTSSNAVPQEDAGNDDRDDPMDVRDDAVASDADTPEVAQFTKDYEYLLGMKLWSLTLERIAALEAQLKGVELEIRTLESKSPKDLWIEDLTKLEVVLKDYFTSRDKDCADALKKLKDRKRMDVSKVKVSQLSDTARRVLNKDVETADKKQVTKRTKPRNAGGEGVDGEDESAPKPKAKRAAAPRKKKPKKGSDEDDDDDSDDMFIASEPSDDDDDGDSSSDDDDDVPLAKKVASGKKKTTTSSPPPPWSQKSDDDDDDTFDLDKYGTGALKASSKAATTSSKATPKPAPKPRAKKATTSEPKPKKAPAPKKTSAAKTTKKKGRNSSDSEDEFGESEPSESSPSESSDDDDDSADSDTPVKKKVAKPAAAKKSTTSAASKRTRKVSDDEGDSSSSQESEASDDDDDDSYDESPKKKRSAPAKKTSAPKPTKPAAKKASTPKSSPSSAPPKAHIPPKAAAKPKSFEEDLLDFDFS
eukprot:PhF_6_TR15990/c0_g1_i1/m.25083/K03164/TOP2; DNA topoisomerase II